MEVGEKIQHLIQRRGLKQAHVEDRAGLARNRISKWVSGKGQPTLKQAIAIARLLGCSVESLADETEDERLPEVADLRRRILEASEAVGYLEALRRVVAAPAGGIPASYEGWVDVTDQVKVKKPPPGSANPGVRKRGKRA